MTDGEGVSAHEGGIVISGAENIEKASLSALRGALRMEARGMKRRGKSARAMANERMGTSIRTARATYEAFNAWLVKNYGLRDWPLSLQAG